jgi:hypothetical protein
MYVLYCTLFHLGNDTHLVDNMIMLVLNYGAEIWGNIERPHSEVTNRMLHVKQLTQMLLYRDI